MKRKKKKFYKELIHDIEKGIWNMELRIKVIEGIRENFRKERERLGEMAKAHEEATERLMEELGIRVRVTGKEEDKNMREELEAISKAIPEIELAGLNEKARAEQIDKAAERTRQARADWLRSKMNPSGKSKEQIKKIIDKINELIEMKQGFEKDSKISYEKAEGVWIEAEARRDGGLKQQIEELQAKIAGGYEFIDLIKEQLK